MQPPIGPADVLPLAAAASAADAISTTEPASPEQLQALFQLVLGYQVSQALYVAAKLSLADLLADRPHDVEELAHATTTDAPTLFRLMRYLAGFGVFAEVAPRRFALTGLGAGLRSDIAGSMGAAVLHRLDPSRWQAWGDLLHSVQTGETAFEHVHGMGLFSYLQQHPDTAAVFDRAMTGSTARSGDAIAGDYDWSGIAQVVNVGGGHGFLLATVLQAYPTLRGVLFDRPEVVANAPAVLAAAGVTARCAVVGGDFFAGVPAGADIYILRFIIHDWDDAHAQAILEQCRRAMDPAGRLLVLERVIGTDYREGLLALHGDMQMLVNLGGRERTEEEYQALFAAAGFRVTNILPLAGPELFSVFEAVPA
jgi:hypothetical protein